MQSFTSDNLKLKLQSWVPVDTYWVAYSGGADSTALLLSMAGISDELTGDICAIHINHGLHPQADAWQAHCEDQCEKLGVTLVHESVSIEQIARQSPEAQARTARYAAMLAHLGDNDMLLTAHHADDQAETMILNLMRGSGVDGLAAMQAIRRAGNAWLGRPLLDWRRQQLRQYLAHENISFVDDPSNEDHSIRRNFVRHEILPRLEEVWPAATEQMIKSAEHMRSASDILISLASADLGLCQGTHPYELNLGRLLNFDPDRQALILRQWARENDVNTPSQRQLAELLKQLPDADEDNALCLSWPGAEVHHYRNKLYIMQALPEAPGEWHIEWDGSSSISLPAANGELRIEGVNKSPTKMTPLRVHARSGNERIQPVGQAHHKSLKQLFQSAGIPPWLRSRIPLLSRNGECIAVGDVWLDQAFADQLRESGLKVHWQPGLQQWQDQRSHILGAN